jgi:hypothetical protein
MILGIKFGIYDRIRYFVAGSNNCWGNGSECTGQKLRKKEKEESSLFDEKRNEWC